MKKKQSTELLPSMRSAEEWAVGEILRAGEHLNGRLNEVLKPFGVSFTQYTALRIVRDGEEGIASSSIGERMHTRDSDVTRLVDRLIGRGLVERSRDAADRRIVRVRLTEQGTELIERLDAPVLALMAKSFAGVKAKRVRRLIEVLGHLRGA
ncbi:MAG: MarR family transcriptional regulator [Bryobacterales bacterium]